MIRKQFLTASAITLLVAAAPLGFSTPAAAKGASHISASHGHASSRHASAHGQYSVGGGGAGKSGKSSAGRGGSGGNGLDTARSIVNLVGGFLPH
jgi:hypothetical protein